MTVKRHSSRREKLDASLLRARLAGAASYDRIAGFFRSSLLEVAGEAIEGALKTIGLTEPPDAKVARIKNTLDLEYLYASDALLPEIKERTDLEIVSGPHPFTFTAQGDLTDGAN